MKVHNSLLIKIFFSRLYSQMQDHIYKHFDMMNVTSSVCGNHSLGIFECTFVFRSFCKWARQPSTTGIHALELNSFHSIYRRKVCTLIKSIHSSE